MAQFIPIENVAGKKLAYIYSIHQDKALLALYSRLTYNVILTTLILTVLLAVALFLRQHHAWLNKQKLLLEEKVIERTKQIEFSLQKELYIKRVLETIFTVSEHLNVAEKIDNLLYESCERLTLHEHYHFAHIKTFNDDLQVALSRSVIRQGMQIQNIQRFYELMEKSNGIEERIHNGDIVIIKNIDEHAYAQPIIEFIRRNHINTAVLIPLSSEASVIDIFGYLTILTSHEQNLAEERILFKELGQTISQAILSLKRKEKYEQVLQEKVSNYKEMIFAMVELMEKRDAYTAGHTRRVSAYSRLIAEKMGLDQKAISDITEAAMLHDIGKIVTPDSILLKPGRLNDEEFAIIKDHVTVGAEVLDKLEFFKELKEIMLYHHEKYDGSGYPFGLKGEEIPLLARIMTVADAFDAMTSHRIYKSKLNIQQAIQELERGKGSHFDPSVVNVAKKVLQEVSLEATESQLPVSGPDYERMAYYFKDQLTGLLNESYLAILLENHFVGQSIKALQVLTIQAEGMQAAELEKRYTNLGTLIKPAYPTSLCFFIKSGVFILIHRDSIHLKQQEQLLAEFEAQNGVVIHIENLNMIDEEQCVQRLEAIAGLEPVSETPVQEN
ncbi:HD-GYP domain-containing protein [Thiomicrorhabdus sp. 6S2-11]|uniref:HD-GYP domain-containing protein n=1 Tax=Thiomicrorhabdus marina TaxID=2818442 RepID=A0ABS3Q6D5_9GAMM|nr:HD-GYP domain-containing protein [Thiomicrorhabdus marina]